MIIDKNKGKVKTATIQHCRGLCKNMKTQVNKTNETFRDS